jgi:8-oxo-dGTP pyrophosphatase MutT (NUDIX family)/predicted kinase
MCEPCYKKQIDQIKKRAKIKEATKERRNLCKAVFMAGGPASGKSTAADQLFKIKYSKDHLPTSEIGVRIINSDDMLGLLAKKPELQSAFDDLEDVPKKVYSLKPADLGGDMDSREVQNVLRPLAKELMAKVGNSFVAQREPVVIDGTGGNFEKVANLKARLEELGYDCSMVMVHVDLKTALRRNAERPRTVPEDIVTKLHGKVYGNAKKFRKLFSGKFYEIESGKSEVAKIKDMGQAILDGPVENPKGQEWIALNALVREQTAVQMAEWVTESEPTKLVDKPDVELDEGVYDKHVCKAIFMAGGGGSGKSAVANQMFDMGNLSKEQKAAREKWIKGLYLDSSLPLSGMGVKVVNTDEIFELLSYAPQVRAQFDALKKMPRKVYDLKPKSMGGDMDSDEIQKVIRPYAKKLAGDRRALFLQGRLPLLIDGTGRDAGKLLRAKKELESIGYDCYMVYVKVDVEQAVKRNQKRSRTVEEPVLRKAHRELNANIPTFKSAFGSNFKMVVNDDLDKAGWAKAGSERRKIAASWLNSALQNLLGKEWIQRELVKKKLFGRFGIRIESQETVDGQDGTREYKSAVAIILNEDGQVLVGRAKSEDDRNGKLCFPGGGIDPEDGADPLAAAKREAFEETGLEVRPFSIIDHPEKPGVAFVVCEYVSGQPEPNQEFTSLQWIPLDAAKYGEYPDVYPQNRQILWRLEGVEH